MSILGNIFNRIFHHGSPAAAQPGAAQPPTGVQTPSAPQPQVQPATQPAAAGAAATAERVDVAQVLDGLAAKNGQKLNWRTSIVDLMKLVGMDSTLQERKELADELGYSGDKSDSATMNMWLHKQVLKKLQDNGGKVPADLLD
jgi:hypothetical protein